MRKWAYLILAMSLAACGGKSQDQQIAENAKQIEILKQQAEIKRLQNETNAMNSADSQVYQLAASEVANVIPANAAKTGEIVQGTDGQKYTYDSDSGNWLLYGAIGAAAGYLAANAMNNRQAAKYTPVQKPTAAVTRVYRDYRQANPTPPTATRQNVSPRQVIAPTQSAPAYRPTNRGYSNTHRFGSMRRRR